jgi:DNA-directed RNA polymerase specialized sigma24 family protein
MNGSQPDDDERRFDTAFNESRLAVFRFAVAWTNDVYSAEDIAQEAFTRLWDRRDSVDWDKPVIGWLLVVTRRLATDRFCRRVTPFAGNDLPRGGRWTTHRGCSSVTGAVR